MVSWGLELAFLGRNEGEGIGHAGCELTYSDGHRCGVGGIG